MTFLLNHIVELFSGLAALIAGGYVWYLKQSIKSKRIENQNLKEEVAISRITKDVYKKQLENNKRLTDEKEKLKEALNHNYVE